MIKHAFGALRRSPGVFLIAIASLALGTGANFAIFSIYNQALLKPLPVPHPKELVTFRSPGPRFGSVSAGNAGNSDAVFSYPLLADLRRAQSSFTGIAAHRNFAASVSYQTQTFAELGLMVSGNYFRVLQVVPAIGRLLDETDDAVQGQGSVTVLSYSFWQSRFGADPRALNATLIVNGEALTIVGVAPERFQGTTLEENPQLFVPLSMAGRIHSGHATLEDRNDNFLYLFARLMPGVSREQAEAAINGPFVNILKDVDLPLQTSATARRREEFLARRLILDPGARGEQPNQKELAPVFFLLFAITSVVLVIASSNIANLLLARAVQRTGEMAVMLSLGASRGRVAGQMLAESCLVAFAGSLAGIAVARWTLDVLRAWMPDTAGAYFDFHLDARVTFFIGLASVATGVLSGVLPAVHSSRLNLISALRAHTGTPSGTRSAARLRSSLASAQIALAMGLLVVAALFARSLQNISRVELGMKVEQVSTFHIAPQLSGYTPERARAFFERVEQDLSALPGVVSVSGSTTALLAGDDSSTNVVVEGYEAGADADSDAYYSRVGSGLFATLGVQLIAGREFTASDGERAPKVAIVNEAFAKKFNLGRDVVGKRMQQGRHGGKRDLDIEIIGLLRDAKYSDVKRPPPPQFYVPYRQVPNVGALTFYVRSSGDPAQTIAGIRRVVSSIDARLPIDNIRTMNEQVQRRSVIDRLLGRLSLAFAALAVFLAAMGLYGVLAHAVAQRTREIGVRMALGADRWAVRRFVLAHVGRLLPAGLIVGVVAALTLGRLARSLLFGVTGTGTGVIMAAAVAVSLVALIAGLIPARRASRIDPTTALRYD
jgi:predicted permease